MNLKMCIYVKMQHSPRQTSTSDDCGTVCSSLVTVWMKVSICRFLRSLRTTSLSSSSICCQNKGIFRGIYKSQRGYGFCMDVHFKRLTFILSRLQWKRLSASFSWFSSSAVGGLYKSLLESLMGWYAVSSPGASSTFLRLASSSSLFWSNFEGTVCRKTPKHRRKQKPRQVRNS